LTGIKKKRNLKRGNRPLVDHHLVGKYRKKMSPKFKLDKAEIVFNRMSNAIIGKEMSHQDALLKI
jgi:hypothetical protein